MNFRFPHPFENVGDAIKDALDPDTPSDGSLVTKLMNENNRAVEDAMSGPSYHRFTHIGPIATDDLEVPFVSETTVRVTGARIDVGDGSDAAEIAIKVNGSTAATASWSGGGSQTVALDLTLAANDDALTVSFTSGEGDAAVSIRFKMVLA